MSTEVYDFITHQRCVILHYEIPLEMKDSCALYTASQMVNAAIASMVINSAADHTFDHPAIFIIISVPIPFPMLQ